MTLAVRQSFSYVRFTLQRVNNTHKGFVCLAVYLWVSYICLAGPNKLASVLDYFVCVSNKVSHAKCLLVLYQVTTNKDLLSNDIMRFGLVSDKR